MPPRRWPRWSREGPSARCPSGVAQASPARPTVGSRSARATGRPDRRIPVPAARPTCPPDRWSPRPAAVEMGALGAQVRASGGCTAAIGPGAALAAADPRGRIDRYVDHLPPDAPNLADALGQCALTVVALPPAQSAVPDAEIAAVDAARPTCSLLVVVGLAESGSQPRLH